MSEKASTGAPKKKSLIQIRREAEAAQKAAEKAKAALEKAERAEADRLKNAQEKEAARKVIAERKAGAESLIQSCGLLQLDLATLEAEFRAIAAKHGVTAPTKRVGRPSKASGVQAPMPVASVAEQ